MGFLLTPTGLLLIALAVVSVGAGIQTVRLSSCRAGAAETKAELEIAGDRLKQQNAAVSEWQAEAAKARQKGAVAAKKAAEATQSHAALVKSLQARVEAPAPPDADCRRALMELRGGK